MNRFIRLRALCTAAGLSALTLTALTAPNAAMAALRPADVIDHYGDIAEAAFQDSRAAAVSLREAIDDLVSAPSDKTLAYAREAWLEARVPYMQTEVYRFGNAIVDDWEGRVNAWPLDEGLIDYVDPAYGTASEDNDFYTANIVGNTELNVNGQAIDAATITRDLLRDELHEAGGIEANVSIGYHAIEFLLWGQDLNGTEAGAGNRPYTDYAISNCSNGNCERRAAYLTTATDLLIAELEFMVDAWAANGDARIALANAGETGAIGAMLTGMGSLSYGELAGERMQLGLMLHDPEEEHDCFADNTAASHYYDGVGIQNVFEGRYERRNGDVMQGPSLRELLAASDASLADELGTEIDASVAALGKLLDSQNNGEAYDQLIAEGNEAGNALVQNAIGALKTQTRNIERAVTVLGADAIEIEGSDSLDNPSAVFQ